MDQTLAKGLKLLEVLSLGSRLHGITELATELGLAKSNVHRLLTTLQILGYVTQDRSTARYGVSLKLWELGLSSLRHLDLPRVARPHLEQLAALTRETVHLSLLDGLEVIYLDKIDSPEPVGAYSRLGGRAPAYCVATGKVLLAHAREDVLSQIAGTLARYTDNTLTDEAALRDALTQIRIRGYGVNAGEWRATVCGLAAPIRDTHGTVIAAIGISGPQHRLPPRKLRVHAAAVTGTASDVSRALGFVPDRMPSHSPVPLADGIN